MNKELFKVRHPFVSLCYYISALVVVMSTTNPIIIACCFIGSLSFRLIQLKGKSKKSVVFPLFLLVVITLTNPLFVHRGGTILFFLLTKPITLEALVYGFFMGIMIAAVIYLFQNFQTTVDSEQFFYLFGKRFPKLTLILTMIIRFVPLFQRYFKELTEVQKTVQRTQQRSFKEKAVYGLDLFGNLFSWALENAMDSASSMKARAYGIGERSSRVVYRWQTMDSLFFLVVIGLNSFIGYFSIQGTYHFAFYPYTENIIESFQTHWEMYLVFLLLYFTPLINAGKEAIIWHILKSRI